MKIAFVVSHLGIGGLEKVTVRVANELSGYYEIHLIVLGKDNKNYEVSDNIKVYEGQINYSFIDRIRRKLIRIYSRKFARGCYKEIKYLSELLQNQKYDKVIACDGGNAMLLNEVIKQNELNTKLVTRVHNTYNTYFNNYYKAFTAELREALSASTNVIALTKRDQENYSKWNQQTTYIYNPLTVNTPSISNLKNQEIIFVARLVKEQKGLDYLIEIAKRLKESGWIIRVLGDGVDREWLEIQISEQKLNDMFILEGNIKEGIEDYYGEASIFISTSRWEGFGLVITEAMACGLPVIAFENSGPTEILDNGEYGILVPKYDVNEFAQAIIRLIENPNELRYYSQKSLERSNDFSLSAIIKQWEYIIEN